MKTNVCIATILLLGAALVVAQSQDKPKTTWDMMKPGSMIKFRQTEEVQMPGEPMKKKRSAENTWTLKEIAATAMIFDVDVHVSFVNAEGAEETVEPMKNEMRLQNSTLSQEAVLDKGVDKSEPNAPKQERGEENITVAGKSIKCNFVKTYREMPDRKVSVSIWTSEEVPGFKVKEITTQESGDSPENTGRLQMTWELLEYKIEKLDPKEAEKNKGDGKSGDGKSGDSKGGSGK